MTRNRRFLTSIALTTVAAVCISAMGCGDKGAKTTTTSETTVKKVETTGKAAAVKTEEKHKAGTEIKTGTTTEKKTEAAKTGDSEAGSATVPGGGVETP